MFRKILTIGMVAAFAFTASACIKTGIPKVDAFIDKVQAATAKGCKFVPFGETVLTALNALTDGKTPSGAQIGEVANKFCAAVVPPASNPVVVGLMAARVSVGTPTVNIKGTVIPVTGYFVR